MPITIQSPDISALVRRLGAVSRDAPKAFKQALSSIARAAKTETKRAASAEYNVKQARIEQDIRVDTRNADAVVVTGRRRSITFNSYGFKPTRAGLRGSLFKKGKKHTFKSGFVAPGLAGAESGFHKVPFWRVGPKRKMRKGRYVGKLRQPLESLHGPSVADMLKNDKVFTPLHARLILRATNELNRRITKELAQRG